MICYFDRAWCSMSFPAQGAQRCINTACARAASDEHIERARQRDLAFCQSNFRAEACGYRVAGEEAA